METKTLCRVETFADQTFERILLVGNSEDGKKVILTHNIGVENMKKGFDYLGKKGGCVIKTDLNATIDGRESFSLKNFLFYGMTEDGSEFIYRNCENDLEDTFLKVLHVVIQENIAKFAPKRKNLLSFKGIINKN